MSEKDDKPEAKTWPERLEQAALIVLENSNNRHTNKYAELVKPAHDWTSCAVGEQLGLRAALGRAPDLDEMSRACLYHAIYETSEMVAKLGGNFTSEIAAGSVGAATETYEDIQMEIDDLGGADKVRDAIVAKYRQAKATGAAL